jgi:hypothetical protein
VFKSGKINSVIHFILHTLLFTLFKKSVTFYNNTDRILQLSNSSCEVELSISEPATMTARIFRHDGHWGSKTRENRALRFIEAYANEVAADLTLPYSPTRYYAPSCTFFDTTNVTYNGAIEIKSWMQRLFSPFDKVEFTGISFLVIDESDAEGNTPLYTVNAEFMANYCFKGDPEPILAPRLFVFTISRSETEDGFDGLQYVDVKLYWDTALVKDEKRRRAQIVSGNHY